MKEGTYYANNREKRLQEAKEYREQNKDYYNAYYRTWYLKNRDALYIRRKAKYKSRAKPKPELQDDPGKIQEMIPVFVPPPLPSNVEVIAQPIVVSFD